MFRYISSRYHEFERRDFTFEDREAIVVLPHRASRGKPWVFKTEYFDAFPDFQLAMLEKGYHLVYLQNKTRWYCPEDDDVRERLCEFLHREMGLASSGVLCGMSCGGMKAIYFASRYPSRVRGLYLDAPVVNFLSCPASFGNAESMAMEEFVTHTGLTKEDLLSFRDHPLDRLPELVRHAIPLFLIAGDSDHVVPFEENGRLIMKAYEEASLPYKLIIKEKCDHHPHGLDDPAPIVEWVQSLPKEK